MKIVALLLISVVAVVVAWITVLFGFILLGHLLYPDNIHNWVSIAGVLAFGPMAGIITALLAYSIGRKWLRS